MTSRKQVQALIAESQLQATVSNTRETLERARKLSLELKHQGDSAGFAIHFGQILALLALEEENADSREGLWTKALNNLLQYPKLKWEPIVLDTLVQLTIDYFQDDFTLAKLEVKSSKLVKVQQIVELALEDFGLNRPNNAMLLARSSAIQRNLSRVAPSEQARKKRLKKAEYYSRLAMETNSNYASQLEHALTLLTCSQNSASDAVYKTALAEVESVLTRLSSEGFEPACIGLARFYRMTYQPQPACEAYRSFMHSSKRSRLVLRESYIYGEASVSLWYGDYDSSIWRPALVEASDLLERAMAAGYKDARLITSLAFCKAILVSAEAGKLVLSELGNPQSDTTWKDLLKLGGDDGSVKNLNLGVVLRIGESAVITRLGTFVNDFTNDYSLAEELYRSAESLDKRDPIALTNLARFLYKRKGKDFYLEAERLLQRAEAFADRRFIWWRNVKMQLLRSKSAGKRSVTLRRKRAGSVKEPPTNIGDLYPVFVDAAHDRNEQRRGYLLEKLLIQLASLTIGVDARPSYRIDGSGYKSQIDGFIAESHHSYRVECKWTQSRVTPKEIALFYDKLDVIGVSGLFFSMSGYTKTAIQKAKAYRSNRIILLIDGDEVRALFEHRLHLDEMLRAKRVMMEQRSEPYTKTVD